MSVCVCVYNILLSYFPYTNWFYSSHILKCYSSDILQCYSSLILKCYSSLILQCYSSLILKCYSSHILKCYSSLILQCYSSLILKCYSSLILKCYSSLILKCYQWIQIGCRDTSPFLAFLTRKVINVFPVLLMDNIRQCVLPIVTTLTIPKSMPLYQVKPYMLLPLHERMLTVEFRSRTFSDTWSTFKAF